MQLTKPIIFFDIETTGTNTAQDRILQIGAIKITPDDQREEKNVLLNPGIPIQVEAKLLDEEATEHVLGNTDYG
ncbi:MAG: hypothetical protein IPM82_13585 [Saprospiraceae bacterium]|nr:hypothetical protein [Saprospiraceae bacterium]